MALGFEDMGAAQVAAWLRDELKLPQYAAAVEEREVDGEILLDLIARDRLAALGVEDDLQSKVRARFLWLC